MMRIVQYWHQEECPAIIRSRQDQWRKAFPQGYERFDQNTAAAFLDHHFGAEALSGFRACAVPAMASDYFRYHRLAAASGMYVDSAFVPGDPPQIARQTDHSVFALSVPDVDLTPGILNARQVLGRVLLNSILRTRVGHCPWFTLLAMLVRRLVHDQASQDVPMSTGIGVLTVFAHAVSGAHKDQGLVFDEIRRATPPGHDRFLSIFRDFMADHHAEICTLQICVSKPADAVGALFHRPVEDDQRFADPTHWSNHPGSIFNAKSRDPNR